MSFKYCNKSNQIEKYYNMKFPHFNRFCGVGNCFGNGYKSYYIVISRLLSSIIFIDPMGINGAFAMLLSKIKL